MATGLTIMLVTILLRLLQLRTSAYSITGLAILYYHRKLRGLVNRPPLRSSILRISETVFFQKKRKKKPWHQSLQAAEGKEQELRCTSVTPQATEMEVTVSPLVRSIFQNRKKSILDANHKSLRKEHGSRSGAAQSQGSQKDRADAVEDYETMLQRKVQALDEEVAIFKKESERLKKLAKVSKFCALRTLLTPTGKAQPL